MAKLLIEPFRI